MAMDLPVSSLSSPMPMYDPRRGQNIIQQASNVQQPKPDSTVPSPPAENKDHSDSTLADLASSEISLDLQGLIDDAHFGAEADHLFGDLIDHQNGGGKNRDYVRLSPVNSLGSSANSSPGDHHQGGGQDASPPSFSNNYGRNPLGYLPGNVQHVQQQQQQQQTNSLPSMTTLGNAVFVKQEPEDQHLRRQMQHHVAAAAAAAGQNNTYVSSTTHMSYMNPAAANNSGNSRPPTAQNQSSLKSFNPGSKYPSSASSASSTASTLGGSKKKVDRNSDEYRRRRERNNVAVRKSREKAKARTRDTEDRVKFLAKDNERLQKKVELLQEELAVLRSLFSNVGVLPDHIHRELSKHIDNFQQQHNAMACM